MYAIYAIGNTSFTWGFTKKPVRLVSLAVILRIIYPKDATLFILDTDASQTNIGVKFRMKKKLSSDISVKGRRKLLRYHKKYAIEHYYSFIIYGRKFSMRTDGLRNYFNVRV